MRLGILTPVLTRVPEAHARWEVDAGINAVEQVVAAAERLGYDFVTCSEHVAVPTDVAAVRGSTYWDPLATFGYLAARTTTIRLVTFVLVLGYHHPLAISKRYGTLDRVSCGAPYPRSRDWVPRSGVQAARRSPRQPGSARR